MLRTENAKLREQIEELQRGIKRRDDLLADLMVVFPTIKGYSYPLADGLYGFGFIPYDPLSEFAIDKIRRAAQQLRADAKTATSTANRQAIVELRNLETKKATK